VVIILNSFIDFVNLALVFFLLFVELVLIYLEQTQSLSPFVLCVLLKNIIGFLVCLLTNF
jgi:hypothetical protein